MPGDTCTGAPPMRPSSRYACSRVAHVRGGRKRRGKNKEGTNDMCLGCRRMCVALHGIMVDSHLVHGRRRDCRGGKQECGVPPKEVVRIVGFQRGCPPLAVGSTAALSASIGNVFQNRQHPGLRHEVAVSAWMRLLSDAGPATRRNPDIFPAKAQDANALGHHESADLLLDLRVEPVLYVQQASQL